MKIASFENHMSLRESSSKGFTTNLNTTFETFLLFASVTYESNEGIFPISKTLARRQGDVNKDSVINGDWSMVIDRYFLFWPLMGVTTLPL